MLGKFDNRNVVPLQKNSEDYRRIVYRLKLALRLENADIKIVTLNVLN